MWSIYFSAITEIKWPSIYSHYTFYYSGCSVFEIYGHFQIKWNIMVQADTCPVWRVYFCKLCYCISFHRWLEHTDTDALIAHQLMIRNNSCRIKKHCWLYRMQNQQTVSTRWYSANIEEKWKLPQFFLWWCHISISGHMSMWVAYILWTETYLAMTYFFHVSLQFGQTQTHLQYWKCCQLLLVAPFHFFQ
jgi:hypothetical protein